MSRPRPVIIGVGEITDRPRDLREALDPIGLMAAASRLAQDDAAVSLAERIDSVDVVHQVSWRYRDTANALCARLGIKPGRAVYTPGGGEIPVKALHEAALRIADGQSDVALICGGEARHTAQKARREGIDLPWPARVKEMENRWDVDVMIHPMALAHGLNQPTYIYPLYEVATANAWGQTPLDAARESANLWERYAQVAADNPFAWTRKAPSSDEIQTPSSANRMIAWPYTKLMVANPAVNMGSAILLTSEQIALAAGARAEDLVHVIGGAAAREPRDFLERDTYSHSPAQDAVLLSAVDQVGGSAAFDFLELYSCFPCVPKMARRTLGFGEDVTLTVAGGLTFFGGPMNNYMTHAACAMTRLLRHSGRYGLLYGQGEFVTKHHALVLGREPVDRVIDDQAGAQRQADAKRGPVPNIVTDAEGAASLETHTTIYGREGAPVSGVVVARTASGARTIARVPSADSDGTARLTDMGQSMIGASGVLRAGRDNLLEWSFT